MVTMVKKELQQFDCRDTGRTCDSMARGSGEAEVMESALDHLRRRHGMEHPNERDTARVRAAIHHVKV